MPIAFNQIPSEHLYANASSYSKLRAVAMQAGEALWAITWQNSATANCTGVSDDINGSWGAPVIGPIRLAGGLGSNITLYGYRKVNSAVGGTPTAGTVTATWDGARTGVLMTGGVTGLAGGGQLDKAFGNAATGTYSGNPGSVNLGSSGTLSSANQAIVAVLGASGSSGLSSLTAPLVLDHGIDTFQFEKACRAIVTSNASFDLGFDGAGSLDVFGLAMTFMDVAPAPTISANPVAASVTAPSTANFSATVSGTYSGLRWQRQAAGAGAWADVSGGTGGTTTNFTTGATSVSGGSFNSTDHFRLAVDWAGGTVYSTDVALTVGASGAAPSFTIQPTNQSAVVGAMASFSFRVTGSGSLTVQAKKNGVDVGSPFSVTDGVTANYTTPTLLIGDNGASYTFVATGSTSPPATSSAAILTVQQPLATSFSFTLSGGNSLTGLKYAVFDQVTPDLWTAPAKKAANGSSNGSGVVTIDVTGLTTRRIGEKGSVIITNSDGTDTGGAQAATRKLAYYVGAFA